LTSCEIPDKDIFNWEILGKFGEYWKKMFGGEFSVTLDDTGRIALPHRLRDLLEKDKVVITKGLDTCLRLYTTDEWKILEDQIVSTTSSFDDEDRALWQRMIGPNQPIPIDRQGRINIPPPLRIFAGLNKDCIVLGQLNYIEIWAEERYAEHMAVSEANFKAASRKLGARIKQAKELGNNGNSPRSGPTGTDYTVSRPEGQV
jgi:MraZ protein